MLVAVPWTRERRFKDKALTKLLTSNKSWDGELSAFRFSELIDLVGDYNAADRYWRLLTERHGELRGSDYADKVAYAQKKQLDLGYEPSYHENVKKLAEIAT